MMNGDGVLKVGCPLAVTRADGPLVRLHIYLGIAARNHRFDGDAKAILYHRAIAAAPIIGHLGVFMHLATDAVTDKLANHTKTTLLTI